MNNLIELLRGIYPNLDDELESLQSRLPSWRKFPDELPPEGDDVLCSGPAVPDFVAVYDRASGKWDGEDTAPVTHWMPLPEPPK